LFDKKISSKNIEPISLAIIMPVYNAVKTISRSVQSFQILKEKLPRNLAIECKLFIIDDCSNDGTSKKINELILLQKDIVVITNSSNLGPGPSRNKAIKKINNGYIGFLDADDEILPDKYIDSFIKGVDLNSDLITFNGWFYGDNFKRSKYDFDRLVDNTEKLALNCLRGELDGSVIFSIYSLELIKVNNLTFAEGYYEDIPFSYSALLLAKKRYISKNFSYKKHNISSSIVNNISEAHIDGLINSWIKVDRNLFNLKLVDYIDSKNDRIYGLYGYIASLIKSIIIKKNSDKSKFKLFYYLYQKIKHEVSIENFEYNVTTKKDMLVSYFFENFSDTNNTFINDITIYYNNLYYKNA
jgi:poly(ribitol-phosphate) beta-N-acetylglucosaminyltransferase